MKILVTGGAGFIGSHVCERLLNKGHSVTVLDNFSTGSAANLQSLLDSFGVEIKLGSILDHDLVFDLVESSDGCIHLAAALGVKKILDFPYDSFITNTVGTENLIKASSNFKKRLFIASTSEIYGKNLSMPLTEESDRILGAPRLLRWAYSEAKAIDESLAQMFRQSHGLDYVVGRFFNTVGPRQSGMYGMVLPRFVSAATKGEDLMVHGDGTQTRTFCHVKDAADAVMRLFFSEKASGQVFNIGGKEEISIRNLADLVIQTVDSDSQVRYVSYESQYPLGFEDTKRRVPDTSKLTNYTGWLQTKDLIETINDVKEYFLAKN